MARKLRVQYPGAIYHVMNRGDRREPIFNDDKDRLLFLDTLSEACQKTDWQVHTKIRIAARLRRETTMTLDWIANRLCMGAPTHVASLLHRQNATAQSSEKTLF